MTKILQMALSQISMLPEHDQDQLGERLLAWYELRAAIDAARLQADHGDFSNLDAEGIIEKARSKYAER